MIKNYIVDHIYRVINRQRLFVINQIHANPERRSTAQKNFAEVKGQRSAKQTGLISNLQASSSENYNC